MITTDHHPARPAVDDLWTTAAGDRAEFGRLLLRHGFGRPTRRCPRGRPLYLRGELPDSLASVTTLRRAHRRVPPAGQRPVATYYAARGAAGCRHHPLYEVAAVVPMPPLPPGWQARWTAARTCTDCGATTDLPWPVHVGRRLCGACLDDAGGCS